MEQNEREMASGREKIARKIERFIGGIEVLCGSGGESGRGIVTIIATREGSEREVIERKLEWAETQQEHQARCPSTYQNCGR